MVYLLLDKSNQHVRRMSNQPFDYDFENIFTLWEEVPLAFEDVSEVKSTYPTPQELPINESDESEGYKWYCPTDGKWYKIKVKKHHSQRWDTTTGTVKNIIEDYPENFEEEVI